MRAVLPPSDRNGPHLTELFQQVAEGWSEVAVKERKIVLREPCAMEYFWGPVHLCVSEDRGRASPLLQLLLGG